MNSSLTEPAPHRPAIPPELAHLDPIVNLYDHSIPASTRDPGRLVGWAYRCLQKPSAASTATSSLHDRLMLRAFVAPEESPPSVTWWSKLFERKRRLVRNHGDT